MDLYRANILDHYKHPRNFGQLPGADVTSEEVNVSCGDRVSIMIKLDTAKHSSSKKIADIRFAGQGCAVNQASASMLTTKVKGMAPAEVMKLTRKDVEELLGTTLSPSRVRCALLPLEAIQKALASVIQ